MMTIWTIDTAKLKALRESRGLSFRQLAKATGIQHTTLYKMETKDVPPLAPTLKQLAEYYRIPMDELLTTVINTNTIH